MKLHNILLIGTFCTALCGQNAQALNESELAALERPVAAAATLERCKSLITETIAPIIERETAQTAFFARLKFRIKLCCLKALAFNECQTLQKDDLKEPLAKLFQAAGQAISAIQAENFSVLSAPNTQTPAGNLVNLIKTELYSLITTSNGPDHVIPQSTQDLISIMGFHLESILNKSLTTKEITTLTTFLQSPKDSEPTIWQKLRNSYPAFQEALVNTLTAQGQTQFKELLVVMSELI